MYYLDGQMLRRLRGVREKEREIISRRFESILGLKPFSAFGHLPWDECSSINRIEINKNGRKQSGDIFNRSVSDGVCCYISQHPPLASREVFFLSDFFKIVVCLLVCLFV